MTHARLAVLAAASAVTVSVGAFGASPASAHGESAAARTAVSSAEDLAQQLGVQQVPKGAGAARKAAPGADPAISLLPRPESVDYYQWKSTMKQKSAQRSAAAKAAKPKLRAAVAEPLLVDEQEPDAIRGGNDTRANAQNIPQFGSAAGKRPAARILGTLAPPAPPSSLAAVPEDNGSIPLAGDTGLSAQQAVRIPGTIGDGPHGSAGNGTGDFDFYKVSGTAGQSLSADIATPTGNLDSMIVVYDATGLPVAFNDDEAFGNLDSKVVFQLPAAGDYYVAVAGFPNLPEDPFDSGSGDGAGAEGAYTIDIGLDTLDIDYYAVTLRAGDVLSGSVSGAGTVLQVVDPTGKLVFGSNQDATYIYPADSPLVGGGNAVVDHVAARAGKHYVAVSGGTGNYDTTLEVRRSGTQITNATQKIFLDFDGARLNTGIFGGPGVRTLSPLSAFLGRWGIPASQQNALINRIVSTVTENLKSDFAGQGISVQVLNSRDHADPWGQKNVSRLIVGGTIEESGVDTIGIAQSIDPGNYETEETALILLDILSATPAELEAQGINPEATLNNYVTSATNRVKFVGTAIGNVSSHEAGHYLGNWHVDQFNDVLSIMDQGGNFPLLYGVGDDGIGGTADDPDVDFSEDTLNPNEGFTGLENTHARVRWALTKAS